MYVWIYVHVNANISRISNDRNIDVDKRNMDKYQEQIHKDVYLWQDMHNKANKDTKET